MNTVHHPVVDYDFSRWVFTFVAVNHGIPFQSHAITQLEPLVYISVDRFACVPAITEKYEKVPKPSIVIFKYKHLKD
jgi:hypothetical protein